MRLYIEISETAFGWLREIAVEERRDVRDQAAIILETALAQRVTQPFAAEPSAP